MENPMCNGNGTLASTDKYSSPVPVIGLYIAGGSLVCFLLILCDVCSGFRRKKHWFPCRFFSINSFTLTLISVATKIPVDLTTPMPSAEDQLSKLTGTVFMCVTMCFILPSVGTNGDMENCSNVAALTLSVIAMIVNACMQMSTGLIFRPLVVEHSIILFFMLVLLVEFWFIIANIKIEKGFASRRTEILNHRFIKKEENVKNKLHISYLQGYTYSPQFVVCSLLSVSVVPSICTGCSVVLFEAIVRVLVFKDSKFCLGASDYKWSILLIVVIQTLSVVLVNFATVSRWLIYIIHRDTDVKLNTFDYSQFLCLFASTNLPPSLEVCCRYIVYIPCQIRFLLQGIDIFVASIIQCVKEQVQGSEYHGLDPDLTSLLKKYDLLRDNSTIFGKARKDMERCINKHTHDFPKHLVELLSTTPPSEVHLNRNTSCISLLLLVEIAKLFTPTSLHISLTNILVEVFDDVHFIDDQLNTANSRYMFKFMYAKIIWKYGLISPLVYGKRPLNCNRRSPNKSENTVEPYSKVGIIEESPIILFRRNNKLLCDEEAKIVKLINANGRSYATSKELYNYIEQLFVKMLQFLLDPVRRTNAIFKYISDSPIEEYEDRVRYGLKLYCKYERTESLLGASSSLPVQVETESDSE